MPKVSILGEVMVEMAPDGGHKYTMGVAGDTYNTACAIAGLGGDVTYLTSLGSGAAATTIREHAAKYGVTLLEPEDTADQAPGLYIITNREDGERSFEYWRGQSAARHFLQDPDKLKAVLTSVIGHDCFYLSGITLALMSEESRSVVVEYIKSFRAKGGQFVFDPNVRARLWSGLEEARSSVEDFLPLTDIYLPGLEDESTLFGQDTVPLVIDRLKGLQVPEVVLKNGEGACSLIQDADVLYVKPPVTKAVVDTTGAGDSFNGAYIYSRLVGHGLRPSAETACLWASKTVCHRGGILPLECFTAA